MKTFVFNEKNGSGTLTVSAPNFNEADRIVDEIVKNANNWRVEDEDGEDED